MKGYGVPTICSTLVGQEVKVACDKFPYLNEALVCNQAGGGGGGDNYELALLIGSDYYWTIINNEIKQCSEQARIYGKN